jgi:hypothetical protein
LGHSFQVDHPGGHVSRDGVAVFIVAGGALRSFDHSRVSQFGRNRNGALRFFKACTANEYAANNTVVRCFSSLLYCDYLAKRSRALLASNPTRDSQVTAGE